MPAGSLDLNGLNSLADFSASVVSAEQGKPLCNIFVKYLRGVMGLYSCRIFVAKGDDSNEVRSFGEYKAKKKSKNLTWLIFPYNHFDPQPVFRGIIMLECDKIDETQRSLIDQAVKHLTSGLRQIDLATTSKIDPLTKLLKRTEYDKHLKDLAKEADANDQSLALLLIDLDHFKKINTDFGYKGGDAFLEAAAKEIQRISSKNGGKAFRIHGEHGEEIGVLLPSTGYEKGKRLGEEIRSSIEKLKVPCSNQYISATASIGLAVYPEHAEKPVYLEKNAESALQSAKNAGRNRVTSFEQFLLSSQENKREVEWDLEITKTKDRVLPLVERAIERYSPIAVHATLEIQDAGGQRAKYTEVKAVKVLKDQPGPIFFIPLSPEGKTGNFKCKYGKIKRVLLTSQQEKFLEINLSPSPKKEQERSFEVSCDFADSFTKEVEYWDWPFSRSEPCDLTFDILFPAERPCQKWEVLRMSQSGEILEQENTGPLTRISFQKRLQSSVQYRVRWTW